MVWIQHYKSPLGGITLASDGDALTGLWFDGQKYFGSTLQGEVVQKEDLEAAFDGMEELSLAKAKHEQIPALKQAVQWLDLYFGGRIPDFTPPLLMKTTGFRKAVWEILLSIPYGQTMTYGEIARRLANQMGISSMSAQAVGSAVGHNAISLLIPCHRVVGAGGKLTGYAGGLEKKRWLLTMEKENSAVFSYKYF